MRVFLVGHRGMLGHVVSRFLIEQGHEIITSDARYTGHQNDPLIADIVNSQAEWVINATGKTPHQTTSRRELFLVNTQLPIHLKSVLREEQKLIHASTDGVFSGRTGKYEVTVPPDAEDDYGLSKALAEIVSEPQKAISIRCSIVGPDREKGRGLMSWFLKQKEPVDGFIHHRWNGITTLEWAKICHELITGKIALDHAILQPASSMLSKFELLKVMGEVFGNRLSFIPKSGSDEIDRTLVPNLQRAPIAQQLVELRDWYGPIQAV